MKFRIFGDADCPDAVLAQIAVLSSFDAGEWQIVCDASIDALLGTRLIDFSSLATSLPGRDAMEIGQACCACTELLGNTCRFRVPLDKAGDEMSQLGLPKGAAALFIESLKEHSDAISARQSKDLVPRLAPSFTASGSPWSFDAGTDALGNHAVRLALGPDVVIMSEQKARALLAELVRARQSMQ